MKRAVRMRPARMDDFDAFWSMAEESGPGFTSLPEDADLLTRRLSKSVQAFSGQAQHVEQINTAEYIMMLEDVETGEIGGCSALKVGTGLNVPFFNYRIITLAQVSREAGRQFTLDALTLTNELIGYTEVGTLFLRPKFRGTGVAGLVAQSRYMLMAAAPELFGEKVLSELRGVVDHQGRAPFWDHLGAQFFRMSFVEADRLSGTTDRQFIFDLMPKYPIYVDLLPAEAREVIGRCHADGVPALKMLEREGFRFERVVDIFDGGPIVVARRDMIRTVRQAQRVRLAVGDAQGETGLISTPGLANYSVTTLVGQFGPDGTFIVPQNVLDLIGLRPGDEALIWLRSDLP